MKNFVDIEPLSRVKVFTPIEEKLLVSGSQAARRHAILVIWLVYIASYFSQYTVAVEREKSHKRAVWARDNVIQWMKFYGQLWKQATLYV